MQRFRHGRRTRHIAFWAYCRAEGFDKLRALEVLQRAYRNV